MITLKNENINTKVFKVFNVRKVYTNRICKIRFIMHGNIRYDYYYIISSIGCAAELRK